MRVAVVGPCGAGKSALAERLRRMGYQASPVAQEHSYVPDMWARLSKPDLLIYLDASLETIRVRLSASWGEDWLASQRQRLAHARQHCDLYVCTDEKTPEEVASVVLAFLSSLLPGAAGTPQGNHE